MLRLDSLAGRSQSIYWVAGGGVHLALIQGWHEQVLALVSPPLRLCNIDGSAWSKIDRPDGPRFQILAEGRSDEEYSRIINRLETNSTDLSLDLEQRSQIGERRALAATLRLGGLRCRPSRGE